MKTFGTHLAEQDSSTSKPYRFVYLWFDDPDDPDDPESTADDFISEGEKLGLKGYKIDVSGAYSELDSGGKRFIYGKDNDKDGLTDCNDPECRKDPRSRWQCAHSETGRECFDGKDNDRDGQTDCKDPSCLVDLRVRQRCKKETIVTIN